MPLNYLAKLTSPRRTAKSNLHLGVALAFLAGALNAGGFLAIGQYTSHMSGIVYSSADNLVLGNIVLTLSALFSFICGAASTAIFVNFAKRHSVIYIYALRTRTLCRRFHSQGKSFKILPFYVPNYLLRGECKVNYDKRLPGCFGVSDLIFAGHPDDEERAFEWLRSLRRRGVGLKDALAQIKAFLESEGANKEHIRGQVNGAKRFLKPWLSE